MDVHCAIDDDACKALLHRAGEADVGLVVWLKRHATKGIANIVGASR
jgi:hypothetical protein